MKLENLLLPFALFFSQSQEKPIPKEKIDRYVEFAKNGQEVAEVGRYPYPETYSQRIDYHGNELTVSYSKTKKGKVTLAAVINRGILGSRYFIEELVIDGIPEQVGGTSIDAAWSENFRDINKESKRRTLSEYHQIIHYVLDSLPKPKP